MKEENKKLHTELEATKAELSKTKEENQKNNNLESELNQAHSKIETIMNDAHNKIVNLETELVAAQEELDKMATFRAENAHRLAIQEELNEACVKVDQLKAENVGLCEELEILRKENHVAERAGLMKALTHACAELDKARIQIADMQSTRSPARSPARSPPINESAEKVKALEDEVQSLQEEIQKLKYENAQRNGLYTALTHSCAELDRVREENAKLHTHIAVLKKVGSPHSGDDPLDLSSKSQVKVIKGEAQEYEEEISRLRAEIIQLRAQPPMVVKVAPSPSSVSSTEYPPHAEISRLQVEVDKLRNYREKAETMALEIQELQKENQKMGGLQVALSHACSEVDKLRDEVTQEKTFSSAMCAQINRQKELERNLAKANGQLEELKMESNLRKSMETQLKEAYAEIDNLRTVSAVKSRLEAEVDQLKADLKQAKTPVE